MIRRNQKLVLRYYKPNRQLYPEKFAYHVLLLFYPFINESDLFSKDGTYSSKLLEPVVSATVNRNRQIFEPNSELIDSLLQNKIQRNICMAIGKSMIIKK